ncbi:MAG: MFS transporter [Gemmatimonadales bacterium]
MTTPPAALRVRNTYLLLTLLSTLSASLIWGVNTLFLLDAGLSNAEAFAANAFFTAGQVIFEVPTGVLADLWGRRASYLLGAATLLLSTLLYVGLWRMHAPLWSWAIASILIGLGFTFFSGATDAWLVDALAFTGFDGDLESVFAKGQVVTGAAMLTGSVAGGYVAQLTNLGMPYVVRSALLGLTMVAAFLFMRDLGFTPARGTTLGDEVRNVIRSSLDNGWRKPPIKWLMLSGPFTMGVSIYAFYALQPYLLDLYGDKKAFGIAGLAAALVAAAQIVGGLMVPLVRRLFTRRTHVLITTTIVGIACLVVMGWTPGFWVAIVAVTIWGMAFASAMPMRQAYLNGLIPSEQRATVLSFDNLLASAGGVVTQPVLGRVADVAGYPASYLVSAAIQVAALPFLALARKERAASDPIDK